MDQNYKYQRIQVNKIIYEKITDLNGSVTINDNKSGVKILPPPKKIFFDTDGFTRNSIKHIQGIHHFSSYVNGDPLQSSCLENPMGGGAW